MAVFMLLIAGIGYVFSAVYGSTGILWGTLIGTGIYVLVQYFIAAKVALGVNGAKKKKK